MRTHILNKILIGIILALLAYISFCLSSPKDSICTSDNGSINELDVRLLHEMTNGYKDYQHRIISDSLGFEDTRMVTFKLSTLKAFLYHFEKLTKRNRNTIKDDDLALNIYYARYPDKNTWEAGGPFNKDLSVFLNNPITEQYEHHHTLVFIPAIMNQNGKYMDFNPKDITTYDNGMKKNERYQPSSNSSIPAFSISRNSNSDDGTSAQNHGGAFPPKTDPNDDLTFYN